MSTMSFPAAGASGTPSSATAASAASAASAAAHLADRADRADLGVDGHAGLGEPPAPPPGPSPRPARTLFMQRVLDNIRPLQRMNREEFEAFLYVSRMYPSLSRFEPAGVEFFVPRRDITVGLAMRTLRERLEHAACIAELVCRFKREDQEEGALCNDDEAVVAAAAIRDATREALGMLGVYEQAVREGLAVVQYQEPVPAEAA